MAHTTTSQTPPFALPSVMALVTGAFGVLAALGTPFISDRLKADVGMDTRTQLPPLSQDAATALHLQSLGKWH